MDKPKTAQERPAKPRKWDRKLKENTEIVLSSQENHKYEPELTNAACLKKEGGEAEGRDAHFPQTDDEVEASLAENLYQAGLNSSYLSNQRARSAQRKLEEYQARMLKAAAEEEADRRRQLKLTPETLQNPCHQQAPVPGQRIGTHSPGLSPGQEESSQETVILDTRNTIFVIWGSPEGLPRKFLR